MKQYQSLFFLLVMMCMTSACSIKGMSMKKNTVEAGAIPPEFGKTVGTLVILTNAGSDEYKKHHEVYAKSIAKYAATGYTGDYKIAEAGTMQDLTDTDPDKYRFFFYYELYEDYSASQGTTSVKRKFYVLDAKDGKLYASRVSSSAWGKIVTGYLMALDNERMKYAGTQQ